MYNLLDLTLMSDFVILLFDFCVQVDSSLAQKFRDAQILYKALRATSSSDATYKKSAENVLQLFLDIWNGAVASSLISKNEALEDVSTTNLKYLQCPHLIGEILGSYPGTDNMLGRVTQSMVSFSSPSL
jgi:hypothetical protein